MDAKKWLETVFKTVLKYTDTLIEKIESEIEKLEEYKKKLSYIRKHAKRRKFYTREGNISELLELTIKRICDDFMNCIVCPAKDVCEFAIKGCTDMSFCEVCPRLAVCLEKGIIEVRKKVGGVNERTDISEKGNQ